MSLNDGLKKMSKSEVSDNSRINLSDSPEIIYSKIKKAKTDSIPIVKLLKLFLRLNITKIDLKFVI